MIVSFSLASGHTDHQSRGTGMSGDRNAPAGCRLPVPPRGNVSVTSCSHEAVTGGSFRVTVNVAPVLDETQMSQQEKLRYIWKFTT